MTENLKKFINIAEKLNNFVIYQINESQILLFAKKNFTEHVEIINPKAFSGYTATKDRTANIVILVTFKKETKKTIGKLEQDFEKHDFPILRLEEKNSKYFTTENIKETLEQFIENIFNK
jgi:6-phosphogluconate dehydrogenase